MNTVRSPPVNHQKQNVSISELLEWSKPNPNRSKKLTPIEIVDHAILTKDLEPESNTLETIGLSKFESITLTPSGILSAIAWMSNPEYPYASVAARHATLRDMATALQQDTDKLQGGPLARKRRRIHDGIAALANGAAIKPDEWLDLFSNLAYMKNLQLIFVQMSAVEGHDAVKEVGGVEVEEADETAAKKIAFSSDPQTWTNEKKTFVIDYNARWIASPTDDTGIKTLSDWAEELEVHGWSVAWPIAKDEKKEDLVAKLSAHVAWRPEHSKLKKDVLAQRLAKYNTVKALCIL